MTALVDPPIAPLTRMRGSRRPCLVRIIRQPQVLVDHLDDCAGRTCGPSTFAAWASTAGIAALWGRPRAERFDHAGPLWSRECLWSCRGWEGRPTGSSPISASMNSSTVISPARTISENFQTLVPEPIRSARYQPFSIAPPETPIAGMSQLAAPITSDGVVLSQPIISTTPSIGLARIASSTVHAGEVAEQHRGRPQIRFAAAEDRKLQREAAGLVDAALHVAPPGRGNGGVAGRQLRPGVADADHRPPVEQVVGKALVLHPAAVQEPVAVGFAEPGHGCAAS